MEPIPKYAQEAIKNGDAFSTEDKEKVKEIVRERLMVYIKDLDEVYIQDQIDGWTDAIIKNSHMYYADLDMTFLKIIPTYVQMNIERLLDDAKQVIQKMIDDSKDNINDE